jgi:hypothetical protein
MPLLLKSSGPSLAERLDEEARTSDVGMPPANPFKELREGLGVGINELAKLALVDRKAISRLEVGMYTRPLPSMVDFWVKRGVATEGELTNDYEVYQIKQRQRYRFYFGATLHVDASSALHPFRQLRARRPSYHDNTPLPVGLTACAQALCIPLDTLQFFEKKYRLQQSVPKPLKEALNQIGYSREQIRTFENAYKAWRELNKVLVRD